MDDRSKLGPAAPRATEGSLRAAAAAAVSKALTRCRAIVMEKVGAAIHESSDEVLAVGTTVTRITEEARQQIGDFEIIVRKLERTNAASDVTIATAVADRAKDASAFMTNLINELRQQDEATARVASLVTAIVASGAEVLEIATQARILTINAQIEAARLGEQGRAMGVIAIQLRALSQSVSDTNRRISDLAETLGPMLPEITKRSRSVRQISETFAGKLAVHDGQVESQIESLRRVVMESLAESQRRTERILRAAQDALSHLQFQDPMAQDLQDIDHVFASVADEHGTTCDGVETILRMGARIEAAASRAARSADRPPSGEVMLF